MREKYPDAKNPLDDYVGLNATQELLLRGFVSCKTTADRLDIRRVESYLRVNPQDDPQQFADSLFEIERGMIDGKKVQHKS